MGASAALASAVASNEVAANGPDMGEKLSRLNARARAYAHERKHTAVFRYYASFKAPLGANAIPCTCPLLPRRSLYLSLLFLFPKEEDYIS